MILIPIKEVLLFAFPFYCTNSTDVDKLLCVVVLYLSIIKYYNLHANDMCIVFMDIVASRLQTICILTIRLCLV